jgi:hypothetical protein
MAETARPQLVNPREDGGAPAEPALPGGTWPVQAWHGLARHGRRGAARPGDAWLGVARQGLAGTA